MQGRATLCDNQPIRTVMADPTSVTPSDLLARSRARHAQYRGMASLRNYPALEACLSEALTLRQQAQALDPEHADPAWIEDQAAMKGVSSADLCAFYEKYLVTP